MTNFHMYFDVTNTMSQCSNCKSNGDVAPCYRLLNFFFQQSKIVCGFCLSYLPWPKFMCEQFFAHTEQNETCELNEFDFSKFHGADIIMCKLPCSEELEHIWMQVRRDNSIKLLGIPSSLKAGKQLRKVPACDEVNIYLHDVCIFKGYLSIQPTLAYLQC